MLLMSLPLQGSSVRVVERGVAVQPLLNARVAVRACAGKHVQEIVFEFVMPPCVEVEQMGRQAFVLEAEQREIVALLEANRDRRQRALDDPRAAEQIRRLD